MAPGKDDLIPVFYKCLPPLIAEEVTHLCDFAAIIDLTPDQGTFGIVAIRQKLLWVGVAFNKIHADCMKEFVQAKVVEFMLTESDTLFNASISDKLTACAPEAVVVTPKAKSKSKAKAKTQPAAPAGGALNKSELMKKIAQLSAGKGGSKTPADGEEEGEPDATEPSDAEKEGEVE